MVSICVLYVEVLSCAERTAHGLDTLDALDALDGFDTLDTLVVVVLSLSRCYLTTCTRNGGVWWWNVPDGMLQTQRPPFLHQMTRTSACLFTARDDA